MDVWAKCTIPGLDLVGQIGKILFQKGTQFLTSLKYAGSFAAVTHLCGLSVL